MLQNIQTSNKVEVIGEIESEFSFSHEVYGEIFYYFTLKIPRLSEMSDYIVITTSERLLNNNDFKIGSKVYITGQFRSYNNYTNSGNKLILTIFAKDIVKVENEQFLNQIILNGFVCKAPIYRTTPFGREITDILLAVNRTYNKSDYIPCITWGRNAKFAGTLSVGDNVIVTGRIQSREYQKKLSETESITKTAYEISVSKIEIDKSINISSI